MVEKEFMPQADGAYFGDTFYETYYKVYYVYLPSPEQALVFSCPTEQEALDYVANNGNYPYVIALVETTTETVVYEFLTEPEA